MTTENAVSISSAWGPPSEDGRYPQGSELTSCISSLSSVHELRSWTMILVFDNWILMGKILRIRFVGRSWCFCCSGGLWPPDIGFCSTCGSSRTSA